MLRPRKISSRRVYEKQPHVIELKDECLRTSRVHILQVLSDRGLSTEGNFETLQDRYFRFRVLELDINAPYPWDPEVDFHENLEGSTAVYSRGTEDDLFTRRTHDDTPPSDAIFDPDELGEQEDIESEHNPGARANQLESAYSSPPAKRGRVSSKPISSDPAENPIAKPRAFIFPGFPGLRNRTGDSVDLRSGSVVYNAIRVRMAPGIARDLRDPLYATQESLSQNLVWDIPFCPPEPAASADLINPLSVPQNEPPLRDKRNVDPPEEELSDPDQRVDGDDGSLLGDAEMEDLRRRHRSVQDDPVASSTVKPVPRKRKLPRSGRTITFDLPQETPRRSGVPPRSPVARGGRNEIPQKSREPKEPSHCNFSDRDYYRDSSCNPFGTTTQEYLRESRREPQIDRLSSRRQYYDKHRTEYDRESREDPPRAGSLLRDVVRPRHTYIPRAGDFRDTPNRNPYNKSLVNPRIMKTLKDANLHFSGAESESPGDFLLDLCDIIDGLKLNQDDVLNNLRVVFSGDALFWYRAERQSGSFRDLPTFFRGFRERFEKFTDNDDWCLELK